MTLPTLKLIEYRSKIHSIVDVFKTGKYKGYRHSSPLISKVIKMYLEIMKNNLLNGYTHDLPKNFGSLAITKQLSKGNIGGRYTHQIHWNNEELKKRGMKITMSSVLRNRMNNLLNKGLIEYRFYDGSSEIS